MTTGNYEWHTAGFAMIESQRLLPQQMHLHVNNFKRESSLQFNSCITRWFYHSISSLNFVIQTAAWLIVNVNINHSLRSVKQRKLKNKTKKDTSQDHYMTINRFSNLRLFINLHHWLVRWYCCSDTTMISAVCRVTSSSLTY